MTMERNIDYSSYNAFYVSICNIYKPLGFTDIFQNHPAEKNREFHLIKDRTRLVFTYKMANKINLCYARITRDILSEPIIYSLSSGKYSPSDHNKLMEVHKFISEK